MKREVRLSDESESDLKALYLYYLVEGGEAPADRFLETFDEMCAVLGDYPEIGAERAWLNTRLKGVRMLPMKQPFRSIVIHYRITDEVVHVIRVSHGARSLGDFADEDAL